MEVEPEINNNPRTDSPQESQAFGNRRNTQVEKSMIAMGIRGMKKNTSVTTLATMNSAAYKPADVIIMEGDQLLSLTDKHNPIAKREHDLLVNRHKRRIMEIKGTDMKHGGKNSMNQRKHGEQHNYQGQVNKQHARNLQFRFNQNKLQIDKQNHIMLKKLVQIQLGKYKTGDEIGLSQSAREQNAQTSLGIFTGSPKGTLQLPELKKRVTSNDNTQSDQANDVLAGNTIDARDNSQSPKLNSMLASRSPLRNHNTIQYTKSMHHASRRNELMRIQRENVKIAQKIFSIQPHMKAREHEHSFHHHRQVSQNMSKIKRRKMPFGGLLEPLQEVQPQSLARLNQNDQEEISVVEESQSHQYQSPMKSSHASQKKLQVNSIYTKRYQSVNPSQKQAGSILVNNVVKSELKADHSQASSKQEKILSPRGQQQIKMKSASVIKSSPYGKDNNNLQKSESKAKLPEGPQIVEEEIKQ